MQRLPRFVELVLVVALCGLIALWATRVMRGPSIAVPPPALEGGAGASDRVDQVAASARLFGSRKPGVLSDNVRPLGVIADASGQGSVIVSVDGQAPKVYRIGDTLDGRLVTAIRPQEIELESGGARQVFRLPPPRPSIAGVGLTGLPPGMTLPAGAAINPDLRQAMQIPVQRMPTPRGDTDASRAQRLPPSGQQRSGGPYAPP